MVSSMGGSGLPMTSGSRPRAQLKGATVAPAPVDVCVSNRERYAALREVLVAKLTGMHGTVRREGRVEVRRQEQAILVLAQVLECARILFVVHVHVETAHDGADFGVRGDGRKVHEVDKDVVFLALNAGDSQYRAESYGEQRICSPCPRNA